MRILITGAKGMLASDIQRVISEKEEVIPLSKQELDITDSRKVMETICSLKPDIVIHCAAFTNVDQCELEPDKAYLVNTVGTWAVASACARIGASLVYISTDYVFDGAKGAPYIEVDEPNPLNVYGKSKLGGEKVVLMNLQRFFIVRTAGLYGANGKNFVTTILTRAREGKPLGVVADQVVSPTYTLDLARAIAELIYSPYYGIYHITNQGEVSWHRFAQEILRLSGLDVPVKPITSSEWPSPARRPLYSALRSLSWEHFGFTPLRNWQEALSDFLSQIGGV
ncbi:dTDP-4-dehydrorhamnose reductase [bacterium]|nr:dTDP-4-dehydrorhamnose reductase [bacterium]